MGNRSIKRVLALCLAVVMMIASSMAVMATETTNSPGGGGKETQAEVVKKTTSANVAQKKVDVYVKGKNAVKYVIQYKLRKDPWAKAKSKTTTVTKATLESLQKGGLYDIRIAGVNKAGKRGAWSTVARRLMNKTAATASSSNGKVVVKLPKTANATGYQIKYSTNADMSGAKIAGQAAKCPQRTLTGLKKGKTYYIQVVPYNKTSNGTVYWGQITSLKVVVK